MLAEGAALPDTGASAVGLGLRDWIQVLVPQEPFHKGIGCRDSGKLLMHSGTDAQWMSNRRLDDHALRRKAS